MTGRRLEQAKLDVSHKTRANLFNWRGQFTPELIEHLLDCYATPDAIVADPFAGSGTVLLESARRRLGAQGYEINPAAYTMSKFYGLCTLARPVRIELLDSFERQLLRLVQPVSALPLFGEGETFREQHQNLLSFFMTFSFRPSSVNDLRGKPEIVIKAKDQDFTIGRTLHYQMSPDATFPNADTTKGELFLSVLSAEIKVNYDKTMFQECCGTASCLKQGCPSAKYFVLVEFLDMEPENSRLTDIDNVFLLRHAKRLPSDKRSIVAEVEKQHKDYPIDGEIIYRFVQEIENFLESVWHDPAEALKHGSFI